MDPLKRNNVKVFGKGKQAMIFGHGFGCDQNMWRYITPAFQQEYIIVLLDHVGAGDSDASAYDEAKYSTLQGYATDILEICRHLNLKDSIYVGHSVGAMIGILSAIQEPERFERLVLVGPSPCYINDEDYTGGFERAEVQAMLELMETDYIGWSSAFAPFVMGNPDRPSLGEELTNSFCKTDSIIAKRFAQVAFLSDNRMDLLELQTKSLILQCAEDMIAPAEVGEYMHNILKGSTLVNLNASGHCPNLSAPLETITAIENYLIENYLKV
ncbi:alpha/beta fold hydrolase [Pontibacter silvestris]|uniref:Alpha/beta fold hydrolase n=1 Tax=Pontibacter silvestris TaxID=2305183 RepID=A0ABW4WWW6_9BACT|nr:alpha/beta hydrolase [Pontibacter silvestris]MCC9137018.1 alpha/beta hydrolase [Pontibacter silvestris]